MNLLTDPLIPVTTGDGRTLLSLPGLLAALGDDTVLRLDGLQRHQEDAFHVFLCYLAGAVLAREEGAWDPVRGEEFWRERLRGLSGEAGDDAWALVVDDPARPAFMQPPVPGAEHGRLKPVATTPDELDLLPTAKNHDVKQARAGRAEPWEWLFALISLQTMSGFFGRGNYGISRMNGGFGNRSVVEVLRHRRPAGRWRDAVRRLEGHRRDVLAGEWGYRPDGLVLVWLRPWDGKAALALSELDPFYLEICRRVRLRGGQQIEGAVGLPSGSSRIHTGELKGVVGDAWLPVDLSDSREIKALTVSPRGLTADLLRRLVFGDAIRRTALQEAPPDWQGDVWLSASVLVRGQGTTDGFHERLLPIPPHVRKRLFRPGSAASSLAGLARDAIDLAARMQNRVLKPAVFVLLEGAPEQIQFDRDSAAAWWGHPASGFEQAWSDAYFPWLWSVPEAFAPAPELLRWAGLLRDFALGVLRQAEATLPQRAGRIWRARTEAERMFHGALAKHFPDLKKETTHADIA